MVNLVVPFPDDLRKQAESAARERGIPLDEFVRRCVSSTVSPASANDPLLTDDAVFSGDAPNDMAAEHDRYLYGTDQ